VASGPSAACSTSRHPDQPVLVRARTHTVPTAACSGQENPTNRALPTATGADCTGWAATALGAARTDPVPAVTPADPTPGTGTDERVSWTSLSVPGEIFLGPPRDGWAALNIVSASAEAAPAARVRVASERRDRNGTSILQRAAVYRLEVG
jgi:hypothetical protein